MNKCKSRENVEEKGKDFWNHIKQPRSEKRVCMSVMILSFIVLVCIVVGMYCGGGVKSRDYSIKEDCDKKAIEISEKIEKVYGENDIHVNVYLGVGEKAIDYGIITVLYKNNEPNELQKLIDYVICEELGSEVDFETVFYQIN